jgi:hypothetical protein
MMEWKVIVIDICYETCTKIMPLSSLKGDVNKTCDWLLVIFMAEVMYSVSNLRVDCFP